MLFRTLLLSAYIFFSGFASAQCPNLVWSDEFDGSSLNTANWSYMVGDGCDINLCGWGNNELQSYQQANASVAGGELSITARSEQAGSSNFTSARLRTINKVDFTYGRVEARIKLPSGGGLWPAFWMLPTDEVYGVWPRSGEIDIMEWVGNHKEQVLGTVHFGQAWPNNQYTGGSIAALDGDFGDEYHLFAIEWEEGVIRWYIDDYLFSTKTRADLAPERWPFDQDFHLLLNMAVGGTLGGAVTPGIFPATMKVDYVRVYDGNKASIIGDRFLSSADRTGTFSILNVDPSTTVTWSAPAGVTINSGQGTSSVNLSWIAQGGILTAQVELPCGSQTMSIEIAAGVSKSGSIENFDATGLGTLSFNSGVLTEVPNPASDAVNSSAIVGKYVRDASTQYDVLQYDVNSMGNVNDFVTGQRQLYMDVYSTAPAGTIILAQLETRNATSSNYPSGRHSRYQAETTSASGWQRLQLAFLDRPDASANANSITKIPVLFEPGVSSGKTFYFDNFDIYSTSPVVSTRSLYDDNFSLSLLQNPVTNTATVDISLKETQNLRLQLINSSGQEIQTLNLGTRSPGQHVVLLETASLPVGAYSITLLAGGRMVGSTLMVKQ